MATILAGDVGGTSTRLALIDEGNLAHAVYSHMYRSGDYESLQAIVEQFLAEVRECTPEQWPARAAFGVAGAVDGRIARITNLPWRVDADRIAGRLEGAPVVLLNDFAAVGHAVPRLTSADLYSLGGGESRPREPIAVIGAGTGLGECFLVWTGARYQVVTTEGGHTDFAPRNPLEIRLLEHLSAKFGRVSYERVVSGQGIVNIYEFLRERERMAEPPALAGALRQDDPAAVISRAGLAREYPICERALDLFVSVYGAEAGNLALKVLAKGGVYLAGGIAAKILPRLEEGGFRHAFEQKGRFTEFLQGVPVFVITHPRPGLLGAAIAALEAK
jgi:glucokinase